LLILVANLPPVSAILAANLPPVLTTPVANNGNNIRLHTPESELEGKSLYIYVSSTTQRWPNKIIKAQIGLYSSQHNDSRTTEKRLRSGRFFLPRVFTGNKLEDFNK
jgi:hypothetical protein